MDNRVAVVTLTDDTACRSAIPNTKTYGNYIIQVQSKDQGGASGIFACCCVDGFAGNVTSLVRCRGRRNEMVDIEWFEGSVPRLLHPNNIKDSTGKDIEYIVHVHDACG